MRKVKNEEPEFVIHIRKRWDAPGAEPAYCGRNDGAGSVTDAWGFYGPTGDGWKWICKECVKAKEKKQ